MIGDGGLTPFPARTDRHILRGTITVGGVAASRRVAVFHRGSLSCVGATSSSQDDGSWEITGMNEYAEGKLFVIAFDDNGEYNAEIADFISQVAET